ncbi:MAG: hypothetical protein KDE27_23075 [Planctomycetes bacterium]|nr:hypothetical protein [Planctomycetota bacterium]
MKLRREFVRDGETVTVTAEHVAGDRWRVHVGDNVLELEAQALGDGGVRLVRATDDLAAAAIAYGASAGQQFMVRIQGRTHTLAAPTGRSGSAAGGGDGTVIAPMTGTVLEVLCAAGDTVSADQTLVVVSAMKMEHKLTAGIAGVVESVAATAGATVEQGEVLAVVAAEAREP